MQYNKISEWAKVYHPFKKALVLSLAYFTGIAVPLFVFFGLLIPANGLFHSAYYFVVTFLIGVILGVPAALGGFFMYLFHLKYDADIRRKSFKYASLMVVILIQLFLPFFLNDASIEMYVSISLIVSFVAGILAVFNVWLLWIFHDKIIGKELENEMCGLSFKK